MQYHIQRNFLCPHCDTVVPVLFQSTGEVTVRDTGKADAKGVLAERKFWHETSCGQCGKPFAAFMRVWFYHHGGRVTIYDSGEVAMEELGVAVTRSGGGV